VAGEIFLGKKEGLETKPVLGKYFFFKKKARTQYKRNNKIEEFKRQRKKQK
jgi:hypothetical protein